MASLIRAFPQHGDGWSGHYRDCGGRFDTELAGPKLIGAGREALDVRGLPCPQVGVPAWYVKLR